jgi:integrase
LRRPPRRCTEVWDLVQLVRVGKLPAYTDAYTAKAAMPLHAKRLTDRIARELPLPASSYEICWCPSTPGFGVRITAAGARAWIAERRVDGKTVRRTLGKAAGAAAISVDAARKLQLDVSSELQRGKDRLEVKRELRRADKQDSLTLGAALRAYVKGKRRAKDGLPLKARTQADYTAMVEPAGKTKNGKPTQAGALHALSSRPLHRITADDIRRLHAALEPRGERQQVYAMQVLRAVLRHYGVAVEGNPLSPATAGAQRVILAPSRGNPSPIPADRLGAWWRAACEVTNVSGDQLRFMLLTGCRPGEAAGVTVADFDLKGVRVTLHDTKNRTNHVVLLSKQAAAIAYWHAEGRKKRDPLFGVADPGKTIAAINAAAGTEGVTPHKLRHTFASIAAELVPAFTLRRLLNHAAGGDVAAAHYVGVSDAQLRAAWQAVADHIESAK